MTSGVGSISAAPSGPAFLPERDGWTREQPTMSMTLIQNLISAALMVTENDIRCQSHARQDRQTMER